jgi:hypothetical protein
MAAAGPLMQITLASPVVRPDGGVLGAARHGARELPTTFGLVGEIAAAVRGDGPLSILSAWLLEYQAGDFAALHTDRPDSNFTALVPLQDHTPAVITCIDLVELTHEELCGVATAHPFPQGSEVALSPRHVVAFNGSAIPHYRPPVSRLTRVLSLSLRRVVE